MPDGPQAFIAFVAALARSPVFSQTASRDMNDEIAALWGRIVREYSKAEVDAGMRELERMFPRPGDRKGSTMTATTRRAAPGALASASALVVPSALVAAAAPASLSNQLRAAIGAHQLAQANVDAHSGQPEEAFSALSDLEGEAHWKLAETPCATDADFLAKISYLLRHEQRLWGETSHITTANTAN